jgi:hypothetical protein
LEVERDNPVNELEVFEPHADIGRDGSGRGPLGGDEAVDAGAQVV